MGKGFNDFAEKLASEVLEPIEEF